MFYTSASLKQVNDRKGKPWRGTLQYKDSDGKWKQKTKLFSGIQYKRDAQVALNEWREEMELKAQEEMLDAKPATTVADAVGAYLDEQYNLHTLSNGTYQKQKRQLELVIEPLLHNKDFYKLTRQDVAEFIQALSAKYKPQAVRSVYSIFSKVYKEAQRLGKISDNPCTFARLPQVEQPSINYLDEEGRRKFIALLDTLDKGDWKFIAGSLAYYTGMRASEICALQWKHINFATKTIHVEQAASTIKDAAGKNIVEIKCPKSKAGRRTIPLTSQAEKALIAYLGDKSPKMNDFVLDDKHRSPSNMCGCFLSWTRKNGIIGSQGKPLTLHGLRHTFATVCVQSNADIKSLASFLGHARADITLNIYASDDEKAKRVAMNSVDSFFAREEGSDF